MQPATIVRSVITSSIFLFCSASISSALAADSARNDDRTRETVSVLGGMAGGAAVGGPPGAIVGAALGAWYNHGVGLSEDRDAARSNLRALQSDYDALQQENQRIQADLERQRALVREAESACCQNGELVVHFRTASSDIESHYGDDLDAFSRLAREYPDAVIHIEGYADQRGASQQNMTLSRTRAEAARAALRERGLNNMTFNINAQGEQQPIARADDTEGLFFDRRVIIRLQSED